MKRLSALLFILALLLPSWAGAASSTTPAAGSPGDRLQVQWVTTAGANVVPCPANIVDVILIGGGAQGGGGLNNATFGGGGGGGAGLVMRQKYFCTPNESLTITIGTGGSAAGVGSGTPSAGSNGVATTITGSSLMPATITSNPGTGGAAGVTAGGVGGACGYAAQAYWIMGSSNSVAAGASVYNGVSVSWSGEFLPGKICSSGSGGGATASAPGYGLGFQNDIGARTAGNGAGGTGGCTYLFCDSLNVGGGGTGVGGVGIAASAKCYGCGGGGGGGSNGAAGNGGVGMSGVAILSWRN